VHGTNEGSGVTKGKEDYYSTITELPLNYILRFSIVFNGNIEGYSNVFRFTNG